MKNEIKEEKVKGSVEPRTAQGESEQGWSVIRRYRDGRILLGEKYQAGLFGYDGQSEDYNRILLRPDGTYIAHIYTGFIGKRGEIEWRGRKYQFRGYY